MHCKDFVLGNVLAEHLNTNCEPISKYVCKFCHLIFNSLKQFIAHEGSHEKIPKRSKFVTFNNISDKDFNKTLQIFRHKINKDTKKNFVPKSKLRELLTEGVKKKYKIYKCAKCMACVSLESSMRRHTCISDEHKKFCPICEQYFSRKKIAMHMQAHKNKPNVNKNTLNVVYFNGGMSSSSQKIPRPSVRKVSSPIKSPSKLSSMKSVAKIFKCDCGLHYTSLKTILKHIDDCNPELSISSECCSKCNLLFPTEFLVTHLCNHHSKAKKILIEKIAKLSLYKCSCCSLMFCTTDQFHKHVDKNCDPKNGRNCRNCHYNFDKSCFSTHKCSVRDKITYITKIIVIKKTTKFYNVYRCGQCDLSYLSIDSYRYHVFDVNHKISIQLAKCDFCGLKFTHYSWNRHIKLHTNNNDMFRIKVNDPITGNSYMKIGYNIKSEDPVEPAIKPTRFSLRKRKRDSIEVDTDVKKVKNDMSDVSEVKIEFVPNVSNIDGVNDNVDEIIVPDLLDQTLIKNESLTDVSQEIFDTSDNKNELTEKNLEISDKVKARIMVHKYDNRLFRCKYCYQHFMKDSSFYYHVKANNHKEATDSFKCDICDLDFSRHTLPRHKYVHHQKMGLKKEDFVIKTESCYSKDIYVKIDKLNNSGNGVIEASEAITEVIGKCNDLTKNIEDSNDSQTDLECLGNIKSHSVINDLEDDTKVGNNISHCHSEIKEICGTTSDVTDNSSKMIDDTNIVRDTSEIVKETSKFIKNHVNKIAINKISEDSNSIKVDSKINVNTPENIEDSINYTKIASEITQRISELCEATSEIADNVNKTVKDSSNTNIASETTSINSNLTQDSTGNDTKISDDISSDTKINSLSEICKSSGEITEDSNKVSKNISKKSQNPTDNVTKMTDDTRISSLSESCESSTDINVHIEINESGGNTDVISDSINESSEASDTIDKSNENIKKNTLNDSAIKTSNENIQSDIETLKIVYFKCFDCNVCFIKQNMCYEHTLKHKILDPKTYIQCKICNFQFLIDSLKEHMVIHHCVDFRVENVTIHEYKPSDDGLQPKIDTYRAMDKVQSRLISTTTDVGLI